MATKPTVAVLGLGAMGSRMAARLLSQGWPLRVFDIRPEPLRAAVALGAHAAGSPREAAAGSAFAIAMVRDYAQTQQALEGSEGALAGLGAGSTLVLMSTLAPRQARAIEARAAEHGVEVLDAPVSGGTPGAESGTLSIMVGGPAERLERCRPLLQALGERIYHVGARVGDGQSAKMVNQLLCGVHLAAAAEALVLARKAGLDQQTILDIVSHSAASSWMLTARAPRMVARRFDEVHSALAILDKDLAIVLEGAAEASAATPLAAVAREVYKSGLAMGLGDRDDSSLVQVFERLAGL